MQDFDVYDDEVHACIHCGGIDFVADECAWERICTSCGACSPFELFDSSPAQPPYYYKHEHYFVGTIIANAIERGAPIAKHREHLTNMFGKSVLLFYQRRAEMGRKNYPNYQYALLQLCKHLHIDVSKHITLPKMKTTLNGVIRDWPLIDPVLNN